MWRTDLKFGVTVEIIQWDWCFFGTPLPGLRRASVGPKVGWRVGVPRGVREYKSVS